MLYSVNAMIQLFCNLLRTYAVGVLRLRQSGALLSNRVRFFRA